MNRLTFNNIYKCLQSNGIRCTPTVSGGVKVYSEYYFLGTFTSSQGQCVFRGDICVNYALTQHYLHRILNLFECDKVAYTNYDDDYVHYICRIKAIKPQETVNE